MSFCLDNLYNIVNFLLVHIACKYIACTYLRVHILRVHIACTYCVTYCVYIANLLSACTMIFTSYMTLLLWRVASITHTYKRGCMVQQVENILNTEFLELIQVKFLELLL